MQHDVEVLARAEVAKEVAKAERRRRFDLDVRGVLALIVVLGLFGIAFIQLAQGQPINIPTELWTFGGLVIGYYFASRVSGTTGSNGHHKSE